MVFAQPGTLIGTLLGAALLLMGVQAWAGPPWLGVEIDRDPAGGVLINEILPESPLSRAKGSVSKGDVLVTVAGQPVQTPNELIKLMGTLQVGQQVKLGIRAAHGRPREVLVTLAERIPPEDLQLKALFGKSAPDFVAHGVSGPELPAGAAAAPGVLAGLRGTPVVLDFFATWCGPCMYAIPRLSALQQRYPGLRVIGLSDESPELLQGMVSRYQPTYTVARDLDKKAGRAYRIFSYPTLILVDRSGVVRLIANGDLDKLETAVATAMTEARPQGH